MAGKAMDVYLNDHLAGAMLGSTLAKQIQALNKGSALGKRMGSLAALIEEDRQTLIELMERMDSSKNPVKQGTTWVSEKVSRAKLSGPTSGGPEQGTFMALETLSLGVLGKVSLWKALKEVAEHYAPLRSMNLDELIERAQAPTRRARTRTHRSQQACARQRKLRLASHSATRFGHSAGAA